MRTIKSMKCDCGSSRVFFAVGVCDGAGGSAYLWVNRHGKISSGRSHNNGGLRFPDKACLASRIQPGDTLDMCLGACLKCEDEASLNIVFDDGAVFESDEAGAFRHMMGVPSGSVDLWAAVQASSLQTPQTPQATPGAPRLPARTENEDSEYAKIPPMDTTIRRRALDDSDLKFFSH